MKHETAPTPQPTPREAGRVEALRARLGRQRGGRRRALLGLPEILGLAFAALLLLTTISAYFFLLRPERTRLQSLTAERATLETRIASARGEFSQRQDTQSSVREILGSLENFEMNNLSISGDGGTRVYEELHTLMVRNNLRLSGGASYTQLQEATSDATGRQGQRGEANALRVVQSVFPGVGVTLTVEGTYPSLRRFVRDVESSNQFVVINTVELEGVSDTSRVDTGTPGAVGGPAPARGNLVSLRLDMAAYFRRTAAAGR